MTPTAVQTKAGLEVKYTVDDYFLAAEAMRRTHESIRKNYTVGEVVAVLNSTHGMLSLTIHALRAALELQRWHRDIAGMALYLATECYKHIEWKANDR